MTFPILETSRLMLIEIESKHLDVIYQIFSNEDVTKYYGMSPFTNESQAKVMIESFRIRFENKQGLRWGILDKETNHLIGTIGLNNLLLSSKRTEIGYDLLPTFWGNGIMSEAINEVITYCFETLSLFRIGAVIFPENIASMKVIEKLGFQKEGLLRGYIYQNEESHNVFVYSLLKTDWEK
ncbi:GNAT family N-acetyltransferase [Bacillus sp. JJ664]